MFIEASETCLKHVKESEMQSLRIMSARFLEIIARDERL